MDIDNISSKDLLIHNCIVESTYSIDQLNMSSILYSYNTQKLMYDILVCLWVLYGPFQALPNSFALFRIYWNLACPLLVAN